MLLSYKKLRKIRSELDGALAKSPLLSCEDEVYFKRVFEPFRNGLVNVKFYQSVCYALTIFSFAFVFAWGIGLFAYLFSGTSEEVAVSRYLKFFLSLLSFVCLMIAGRLINNWADIMVVGHSNYPELDETVQEAIETKSVSNKMVDLLSERRYLFSLELDWLQAQIKNSELSRQLQEREKTIQRARCVQS